ncbi:MAG: hypothetical protein QOJ98_1614 [Acidobacteriota bacterium]|nr:hypothetical protein [Acidobacteriota bacterium]
MVDVDAAFLVDIDAQDELPSRAAVVDMDELQPLGFNNPLDLVLDLFGKWVANISF